MNKNYRKTLTWISFFSYALTGSLVVVTGIIMNNVSKYFELSISKSSEIFTFLNSGILISIFTNSWITSFVSFKKQITLGFILVLISIITIIKIKSLILFSISIFLLGIVSGFTMSIGTFLITSLYQGNKKATWLLLSDSFFSMSGMTVPVVNSFISSQGIPWNYIYIIIGIIYTLIFILSTRAKFPNISLFKTKKKKINFFNCKKKISLLILCTCALLYILGQLSFISWIPGYVRKKFFFNVQQADTLVSSFWMSYMIGMWTFSYLLKFFNLQKTLIFLSGISTTLMYLFNISMKYTLMHFIIFLLGFFSSAIYSIIISLAALLIKKSSPTIINYILTSGTTGTLLTFILTGPIVKKHGLYSALITANILYLIVFFLSFLFFLIQKKEKNKQITVDLSKKLLKKSQKSK